MNKGNQAATDSATYAAINAASRDGLLAIVEFQGELWKYQRLETEDLRAHVLGAYQRGDLLTFEVHDALDEVQS